MFDYDNFFIEDDYAYDEYDYSNESYCFDDQYMNVDMAIESFMCIDPFSYDEAENIEFVYASEALMDAISTDLAAIDAELYIATEAESGNKTGFVQKFKNAMAKILMGMRKFCISRADKWKSRNNARFEQFWRKNAKWCESRANSLRGIKTEEQAKQAKSEVESKKEEMQQVAEKENSEIANHNKTVPGKGKTSQLGDGIKRIPVGAKLISSGDNNGFDEKMSRAQDKAAANSAKPMPSIKKIDVPENNLEKLPKNVVASPKYGYKATNDLKTIDNEIEKHKAMIKGADKFGKQQITKELQKLLKKKSELIKSGMSSYIDYDPDYDYAAEGYYITYDVFDYESGYAMAVEGLFSKPKTAEKLLEKIQRKVNKLKTVGQCDDMLRQLDAEAKVFNQAMSSLKSAQANFQKTNDKKSLRQISGPILKDLNKRCKILKIKSIASDPKNISKDEIKKLHDFITGSKQLINARKKVLKGGVTESMSYFDYNDYSYGYGGMDLETAYEAFCVASAENDDIAYEIAEENFLDAIQYEADMVGSPYEIATEGVKQGFKNAIAGLFDKLSVFCRNHAKKLNEKVSKVAKKAKTMQKGIKACHKLQASAAWWERMANILSAKASKFRGEMTDAEYAEAKKIFDADKKAVDDRIEQEKTMYEQNDAGRGDGTPADSENRKNISIPAKPAHRGGSPSTDAYLGDFTEADRMIALATEGIINPDFKRAHRIKFGEKKRQIKSVLKKARAAKKAKDFAAAIALYQEAKKGYAGLLAEAKKLPNYATGAAHKDYKSAPSLNKTGLINWCISKMSECDNAIEAIRNGQMKSARKAASNESYLDDVFEYEAVAESYYNDDDDFDDYDNDYEDYDDYEYGDYSGGLESLLR